MPISIDDQTANTLPERIVVAGPDKMALTSFLGYLGRFVGHGYTLGAMQSLMTPDAVQVFLDRLAPIPRWITSYYARRKINVPDPISVLPAGLVDRADTIFWFNLYDTIPTVLKQAPESTVITTIIDSWKKRIGEGG